MGKRAAEHGVTATIRYYARTFPDLALKETTVRRLKNKYQASLKSTINVPADDLSSSSIPELVPSKTGCPLMLGEELDKLVRHYLGELCDCGGVVNTRIIIAVGLGVVSYKDANLLAKYGRDIVLTKHWAMYLL